MATFGQRLTKAMEMRDINAAELSRKSGVNEGSISQYKKEKYKASQPTIDKLAQTLNVSIPWLMGAVDTLQPYENKGVQTSGLTAQELILLEHFRKLNKAGQDAAIEFVSNATFIPKFTGSPEKEKITSA